MQRCLEVPARASNILRAVLLTLLAGFGGTAVMAQSAPAKTTEEMERAQRDADKVFKMIILNSDAPRKKRAPDMGTPAANAAAAAAAAAAPKPAAAAAAPTPLPAATQAAAAAILAARASDAMRPAASASAPGTAVAAPSVQVATAAGTTTALPGTAAAVLAPPAGAASAADEDDEDDSPLVAVSQTRPSFKPALIQELRQGTVRVKFEIQPNGSVNKPEIVSSTNRGLNPAALSAIGQWKFKPIKKPRMVQVEVGFNVDN